MQKSGIVTSIWKDKNSVEKINIDLDNSQTENSCSIKQEDCYSVKTCATCGGCGFAGKNKERGLLAVSGNKIIALNKTGKALRVGEFVIVEIKETKTKIQAAFSIFLPVIFASIGAAGFSFVFKTEPAVIGGLFLGLLIGGCFAFFAKKKMGDTALPEVIE